jgi:hypothetical protein
MMTASVFISYRRNDSRYQARMIYGAFQQAVPRDRLFMDVDSIPPGADFVGVLQSWVTQCEIMLALIGPGWIEATDPKTGRMRLDDPNDFVRIEIREALSRNIPVVPVLLDETPMPKIEQLPDDMKGLVRRQAEFVAYRTFDADVRRLIKELGLGSTDEPAMSSTGRIGSLRSNQVMLGWLGGALVVAATGLWAAFAYFFPHHAPVEQKATNAEANCGGVAVVGNVTGATITTSTTTNSDCSTKPR